MSEPGEQAVRPPRTWRPMILWATGILLTLGAVAAVTATSTDLGRFRLATIRIKHCPEGLIARRFDINTLDSFGVSSGVIAESVDRTYDDLSAAFAVPPKTYYSECGDCPTQETVWQFPGYFVRLYASLRGRQLGGDLVVGRFAEDRSDARTIALVHKLEKLPLSLPADAQWRFRPDEAVKLEVSLDRDGPAQLEGASGVAFMPWEDGRASVASRSMKDLATPGSGRVELMPGRYWARVIYWPGTVRPPDHTILETRPLGWIEVGKDSVTSEAGPVKVRLAE